MGKAKKRSFHLGINDQFTKLSRSEAISHVVDMLKKGNGIGCTWYALNDINPDDNSSRYWENLPK